MILDALSIPVLFLFLIGTALLAVELGFPVGRWYRREEGLDKYPLESAAKGSLFGLLAFILAFAFGVSATRYQAMRDLAREDFEAIEDVFKTSQLLDEAKGEQVRDLVRKYHQIRTEAISSRKPKVLREGITRSEEINDELWSLTVAYSKDPETTVPRPFVAAVQTMDETHSKRVYKALVTRHPLVIWITLLVLLLASSFMLGFNSGLHGRRSRLPSSLLLICFVAVIVMIVDLDRPFRTLFKQAPSPLAEELTKKMAPEP